MRDIKFEIKFRYPVRQTTPTTVECVIPARVDGIPVLNPAFVKQYGLTPHEVEVNTEDVLRATAVLPPDAFMPEAETPREQWAKK